MNVETEFFRETEEWEMRVIKMNFIQAQKCQTFK